MANPRFVGPGPVSTPITKLSPGVPVSVMVAGQPATRGVLVRTGVWAAVKPHNKTTIAMTRVDLLSKDLVHVLGIGMSCATLRIEVVLLITE